MNAIIRGTTPTIKFTFDTIESADLNEAFIVVKSVNDLETAIIKHDITDATTGVDYIQWKLTQTDTLKLTAGDTVNVYCDWTITDGDPMTRGRSQVATCRVFETGVDEVI